MPSTYAVNFEVVPTANSVGVEIDVVNAAINPRRMLAQPFPNSLVTLFEGSDVDLPVGFVNHAYGVDWNFTSDPDNMTLYSGSLPPGLTFTFVGAFEWTVTGTPTTVGTYTFTIQITIGVTVGYTTFHITINDDPDEGAGGVGGG